MSRTEVLVIEKGDARVEVYGWADVVNLSVEDDWCGCTETGFGATVSVNLCAKEARKLMAHLAFVVENIDRTPE